MEYGNEAPISDGLFHLRYIINPSQRALIDNIGLKQSYEEFVWLHAESLQDEVVRN